MMKEKHLMIDIKSCIMIVFLLSCFSIRAQDFGVKNTGTPPDYIIGGGLGFQLYQFHSGNLPLDSKYDRTSIVPVMDLHFTCGMKKYFGTSGIFLQPAIPVHFGLGLNYYSSTYVAGEPLCMTFGDVSFTPSISLGFDIGDDYNLFAGLGYWGDYIYAIGAFTSEGAFTSNKENHKQDVSLKSNYLSRFALIIGVQNDSRDFPANINFLIGLGNPLHTIDIDVAGYDCSITKPVFLFSLDILKKYKRY